MEQEDILTNAANEQITQLLGEGNSRLAKVFVEVYCIAYVIESIAPLFNHMYSTFNRTQENLDNSNEWLSLWNDYQRFNALFKTLRQDFKKLTVDLILDTESFRANAVKWLDRKYLHYNERLCDMQQRVRGIDVWFADLKSTK